VKLDRQVRQEQTEAQGQLDHRVTLDLLDLKVIRVFRVWLAILAHKGQLDLKEMLELRVALGQLDRKAI
jgi:hypothetical protein